MNRQNRPRNRQPRAPRDNNRAAQASSVPNVSQVLPGASVSIVLKEDQPTGDETSGVVQYVLTKGNHPRGIKVRLRDGQVGRVQKMMPGETSSASNPTTTTSTATPTAQSSTARFTNRYTDVRNEEELEGPPPRSLADFFPKELDTREPATEDGKEDVTATARCPICDAFEGDEEAVSYHVERECLAA